MKIGINVATGLNTPSFGTPLTLGLATLMIVLIIILSVYGKGFIRTLSLFVTMVIGYVIAAMLGLLNFQSVADASWVAVPNPFPYGGLQWPGIVGVVTVIVCFFATAVETTGHTLACCRITGVPGEDWRVRGAVANDGIGSVISAIFGGMALTSYSQNIGVISLTGVGSRFVVAAGGAFNSVQNDQALRGKKEPGAVPEVPPLVDPQAEQVLGDRLDRHRQLVAAEGGVVSLAQPVRARFVVRIGHDD